MAYSKTTFQQLQLSLAYRYGETSIPSTGTSNRNHWLNRGVQYCADKLQLKKSDTVTIASGVGTLPTDFKAISSVIDANGNVYTQVNHDDYTVKKSSDAVYTITGDHTSGYILNIDTDADYTVHYYFFPEDMVNNGDICIIPDGEAIVAYAYGMLRKSETDPLGDATQSLQECDERLKELSAISIDNEKPLRMRILSSSSDTLNNYPI